MSPRPSISALLVLWLAALAGPAAADDAPGPALGRAPDVVVRLEGRLQLSDHRFGLTLCADGTARAELRLKDPLRLPEDPGAIRYEGRWRPAPFDVRLRVMGADRPRVSGRELTFIRRRLVEDTWRFEHRFPAGGWIVSDGLAAAEGALPGGPAGEEVETERLEGVDAAYAVAVEDLHLSPREGGLFASLVIRCHARRPVTAARLRVTGLPGEEAARELRIDHPLEPSDRAVLVDVPLGAALPEGARLEDARALAVAATTTAALAAPRLGDRTLDGVLAGLEVLFSWPLGDEGHVVLLTNRSDTPLRGVVLDAVYQDAADRTLERLPMPVEGVLAPGEVRLLDGLRPTPRGGIHEAYYLFGLARVRLEIGAAYPAPGDARLGGDAKARYAQLGVRNLKIQGTRRTPIFRFDVENTGGAPLEGLRLAVAGTDALDRLVALIDAPLDPPRLAPGEERSIRIKAERIFGIPDAVLTWTVIPVGLEPETP